MNREQAAAHQERYTSHGIEHREIGLRAVAAAVLYHGSKAGRTASWDMPARPAEATPATGDEP